MSSPLGFQQRTADYAVARLWDDPEPTSRFLVADEVGLGKTIVAREIVGQTLARFPRSRTDIVYLCSSQAIASQNLRKLRIGGGAGGAALATRLTLLALNAPAKRGEAPSRVRYFAITPETSFNVTARTGQATERALIFRCLERRVRTNGFDKLLQLVSDGRWASELSALDNSPPDPAITDRFVEVVTGDAALMEELRALSREVAVRTAGGRWAERTAVIGRLRQLLAKAGVQAVARTGLVVVDEFQRFSHLLRPLDAQSSFAQQLAGELLKSGLPRRRVLLLSATPYRLPGAAAPPGETPYDDFVGLVRFLADDAGVAARLEAFLTDYARALRSPERDEAEITTARDGAQRILRSVMTRTERVGVTVSGDAMVQEDVRPLDVAPGDLQGGVAARRVARRVRTHDPVEYWKSAPYLLDFMRGYQLRNAAVDSPPATRSWVGREARAGALLIDPRTLRQMKPLPVPNARLRDLINEALPPGAERLLWLNPSLPYTAPAGPFAGAPPDLKHLVFSEWRLAPDSISALVSYETEQRLHAAHAALRRPGRRARAAAGGQRAHKRFPAHGELLRLGRSARSPRGGVQGLAALSLMIPSAGLASLGDPLTLAIVAGAPVSGKEAVSGVRRRVTERLKSLPAPAKGRADERWYWAAPLLLDREAALSWLAAFDPFGFDAETRPPDTEHLIVAMRDILRDPAELGPRPRDLAAVLAQQALAGFGTCALRALQRTLAADLEPASTRRAAFRIARGLQAHFNQAEASLAVTLTHPRAGAYWRQALAYCLDGNLQALLDEQLHLAADGLGLFQGTLAEKLDAAARTLHQTLTLRRGQIDVSGLNRRRRRAGGEAVEQAVPLRCRHALRFAEIRTNEGPVARLDAVREAFNSPFRPFVLASTSIGQEGLDFHPWCHAVVHWNLPRSPVELEQREGRVHRYKGHAVRLNVAAGVGLAALKEAGFEPRRDPWAALFELAAGRDPEQELAPNWVFDACPSPVRVRRIVPHLKLSREADLWPRLRARLGAYRLVMGLPRQDDLAAALEASGITLEDARKWRIDLRPQLNVRAAATPVRRRAGRAVRRPT